MVLAEARRHLLSGERDTPRRSAAALTGRLLTFWTRSTGTLGWGASEPLTLRPGPLQARHDPLSDASPRTLSDRAQNVHLELAGVVVAQYRLGVRRKLVDPA